MPGSRVRIVEFVLVALAVASAPASAQERYRRDWSDYPGMPRNVSDLTHDDRGFLWLAGEEGVHRFDGHEVVPWGERAPGTLVGINRGPDARMVTFTEKGLLFEITEDGLAPVTGVPFEWVKDAGFDGLGNLWVADNGGLYRRDVDGAWLRVESPELEGHPPIRLQGAVDGGAFVGTNGGRFIRFRSDLSAETWFSDPSGNITRIAVKDERTQAFALRFGNNHGIYLVEDGNVRAVVAGPERIGERWTGLAFRGDKIWASSTQEILAISADGKLEILGAGDGFEPGGEFVVDHEKSLWLTSFRGVYQFTEPDVILWSDTDGTRGVHAIGKDIVLGRWAGAQRLTEAGEWKPLVAENYHTFDWGGPSPWGTAWFVAVKYPNTPRNRSALLEFDGDGFTEWLEDDWGAFSGSYATDESGIFWLTFLNSLWRVDRRGAPPREVAPLVLDKAIVNGLTVAGRRVSMAYRHGPFYCEGTLNEDRTALEGDWDCEEPEGARDINDLEMIDGEPWLATWDRGVLRRNNGVWETVLDAKELGTSTVRGITPSPSGGFWVVTFLERVRMEMHAGRPRIVERLGPWIGVPAWRNFAAFEQPDGSIWLSGFSSAVLIPAHARQRPTEPPRVFVTGFRADGTELSSAEPQRLPATTRRIELSWAAPAFRDPASVRFQVRADSDGEWVPTRERSFRFVDLGPGDYRIEVRASLDGENWSATAADVRFAIRSPLWQRPTFWVAMLAVGAIGILLMQWLRTRQQVRFERQRTEIAMNLHDELGAGLGSIGLLTDLAASDAMEPQESREVVTRVGEISRSLSRSLSDIVWTLRPASVDLPGFALFLRQRASDLLSAGDTRVEFDFPDPVPPIRLELAVRGQIHAIASEALHNAAKHAEASKVRVGLRPDGNAWVLGIADDGVGFDADGKPMGLGLESMNKRAASIGATLSVGVGEEGGCRVELRFTPRA